MRAKGKFERPMNEARERKWKEQYGTTDRIFPNRDAAKPVAEKKKPKVVSEERAQLKEALKHLEQVLKHEKAARGEMEAEYKHLTGQNALV
eukprot:CAMPEP_0198209812 /NCGR_PEP_ID=MMETSP1445-20131203/17744_1 /TAXON_ID=36898 /ORGANISM="Pyramimonas sp., Strain CCMP2087" /LENGTH=90 /DNA_ID=CAMNT_0043883699 /DNA_START=242 /DNA_END=514 /DNA_ORIENTATION=-